VDLGLPR
jgi:hypothetical protein